MDAGHGTIVVFQDREWFGDPRLGAFVMSVDGKRVGRVALHGECACQVMPGQHTVRVRQWWFRSPPVRVNVTSGSTARLRADIPLSLSFFRRMAKGLFAPGKCLTLESSDIGSDPTRVSASRRSSEQGRKALLGQGVLGIIGFSLVLVGVKTGPLLIGLGLLLVVVSTALAIRQVASARKGFRSSEKPQHLRQ